MNHLNPTIYVLYKQALRKASALKDNHIIESCTVFCITVNFFFSEPVKLQVHVLDDETTAGPPCHHRSVCEKLVDAWEKIVRISVNVNNNNLNLA